MLVALYKIGKVHYRLLGTNGCRVKVKNERFTAAGWRRQNIKYQYFMSSFGRLRQKKKKRNKKRAARAARFISLIQPIKSLIFGVVIAVIS